MNVKYIITSIFESYIQPKMQIKQHKQCQKRSYFRESLRKQYIDTKKQISRKKLKNVLHPMGQIYNIKEQLCGYTIEYNSLKIHEIVCYIQENVGNQDFIYSMFTSKLLDDLIAMALYKSCQYHHLQVESLVVALLDLIEILSTKYMIFLNTIVTHLAPIRYSLYSYPTNQHILNKIATIEQNIKQHLHHNQHCFSHQLQCSQWEFTVVYNIISVYIFGGEFIASQYGGQDSSLVRLRGKASYRWMKNAVSSFQISYNIVSPKFRSSIGRQIINHELMKKAISCSIELFLNSHNKMQIQDQISQLNIQFRDRQQHQINSIQTTTQLQDQTQTSSFQLISAVLNMLLLYSIIDQTHIHLLIKTLQTILPKIHKQSIYIQITVIIIRILYEQMKISEEQMEELVYQHHYMGEKIREIIANDML